MARNWGIGRLASDQGQRSLRIVMTGCDVAIAWMLSVASRAPLGSVSLTADWVCIALTLATLARSWVWLAVGAITVLAEFAPEQTSMAPFLLTMVGAADLNSRPPARLGALMLGIALVCLVPGAGEAPPMVTVVLAFFLLLPSISAMLLRSQVDRYRASLEESQAQRALDHLAMAREMHDTVALAMSHIVLRTTLELHHDDLGDRSRAVLAEVRGDARDALQELREMLEILRSGAPDLTLGRTEPPTSDLSPLAAEWSRVQHQLESAGFTIQAGQLPPAGSSPCGDPRGQRVAALAARELAANVLRHGDPAQPVELVASETPDHLGLMISNSVLAGGAHASLPSSGHGIEGLRERLDEIGGTLQTLQDGDRWLSAVRIPVTALRPPVAGTVRTTPSGEA